MIASLAGAAILAAGRLGRYLVNSCRRRRFRCCGRGVTIGDNCHFTYGTISIGDFVQIGHNCVLMSAHGEIRIGSHVMLAPGVHIHGGNHILDRVGVYMDQPGGKARGSDGVVSLDDDVWIGANAVVLRGVTLGEGCIIGAGAVVTHDVPPYGIAAGNPARVIRMRFTPEQIALHKEKLGLDG